MAFLSYSEIRSNAEPTHFNRKLLSEATASAVAASVFLSHSSADDVHVEGIVMFLRKFGALVYTDNSDKRLPQPPTVETAAILKDEIRKARRFVVLISPHSFSSKWIPWELGLADSPKGIATIATLPITPDGIEGEWAKQEYFALYPRIFRDGTIWYVMDPRDGKSWTLTNWLNNSNF